MWIASVDGFYSAVRKDDDVADDLLTIRARVKGDLEALPDVSGFERPRIIATPKADYPYRVRLPREQWARIVAHWAGTLDYGNFKARVEEKQGRQRHDVYLRVWSALLGLQTRRRC